MNVVEEVKRAVAYTSKGNYVSAEKIYKTILKDFPNDPAVLSCLGLLYLNLALFNRAKKYLQKSYNIKSLPATVEGLGLLYFYTNKKEQALRYFEEISDKTINMDVLDKYTDLLLEDKKYTLALKIAEKYKKLYPLSKEAEEKYGFCLMNVGKFQEAYNIFSKLVNKYPKFSKGWQKLGLIYEMYYHDEEMAKMCYENIVKCGDKFCGYSNLLINASKRFDFDDAFKYIKKIDNLIKKNNSGKKTSDLYLDVNFTKSVIYFKHRDFLKAYKYYLKKTYNLMTLKPLNKLKNIWNGKGIHKNETLLVYLDQGIGDEIMFSRYLPLIAKNFKLIKVLDKTGKLTDLLKRSFKEYKNIVFYTYKNRMPKYDKSVIASSLPYLLKMDIDEIPLSKGYYTADNKKVTKYEKHFKTNKLKVGICWEAGSAGWRELLNRTLNISLFEPFFKVKNVEFYSFQVNPTMDNYKNYKNLINLGSTFENYDDTAGALKNLDLLITVDTSVAHLAGALGVKTFMLLPYCPDWRWFDNDKTTEWYDSIKIYKQTHTNTWDDVIENIKKDLEKLSKSN